MVEREHVDLRVSFRLALAVCVCAVLYFCKGGLDADARGDDLSSFRKHPVNELTALRRLILPSGDQEGIGGRKLAIVRSIIESVVL